MIAQSMTLYITNLSWASLKWPHANTVITKATSHLLPVVYLPSSLHASTTIHQTIQKTRSEDLSSWIATWIEWDWFLEWFRFLIWHVLQTYSQRGKTLQWQHWLKYPKISTSEIREVLCNWNKNLFLSAQEAYWMYEQSQPLCWLPGTKEMIMKNVANFSHWEASALKLPQPCTLKALDVNHAHTKAVVTAAR